MAYDLDTIGNVTNLPSLVVNMDTMLSGAIVLSVIIFIFFATLIAMRKQKIENSLIISCSITAFIAILFNIAGVALNPNAITIPLTLLIFTILYKAFTS